MKIKIDKGIEIPIPEWGLAKYPFGEMEIGDSFFIKCDKKSQAINCASSYYGKRNNKKFIVRTVTENGVQGKRVWRHK